MLPWAGSWESLSWRLRAVETGSVVGVVGVVGGGGGATGWWRSIITGCVLQSAVWSPGWLKAAAYAAPMLHSNAALI